jgi:hypothetical protein
VPHREVAHLDPARGELRSKRPQCDVGLLRQPSQKPITLARQCIWPAAANLVSRGASGSPEPLRPLYNARNADLELGRDRTTATLYSTAFRPIRSRILCQSCDRLSCACRSVWSEKVSLSDPVSLCHNQL